MQKTIYIFHKSFTTFQCTRKPNSFNIPSNKPIYCMYNEIYMNNIYIYAICAM